MQRSVTSCGYNNDTAFRQDIAEYVYIERTVEVNGVHKVYLGSGLQVLYESIVQYRVAVPLFCSFDSTQVITSQEDRIV